MAELKMITEQGVDELLRRLTAAGRRVYAPVQKGKRILFEEIGGPEAMTRDYVKTTMSAKQLLFPRFEEILHYETVDKEIQIREERLAVPATVVFGTRPCDSKAVGVLDAVFTTDFDDVFYETKKKAVAVISVACNRVDGYCFCTAVGGGPGETAGSDILLTELRPAEYLAEILTAQGAAIAGLAPELFTAASATAAEDKQRALAALKPVFDLEKLLPKVAASFDDEIYLEQSLRCIGCGACAYVCPACTCFDIQDEYKGAKGIRLRCWDSCGFGHFTLHTSWHNPRHVQSKRWRQRIMHKFYYQPDTLKVVGCSGCGRCSSACPTDMNLSAHLQAIEGKDIK